MLYLFTREGAVVYDPRSGKTYDLDNFSGYLVDDYINSSFVDREKNIWISTQGGLTRLTRSPFKNTDVIGDYKILNASTRENGRYQFRYAATGSWLYFPGSRKVMQLEADRATLMDLTPIMISGAYLTDIFNYNKLLNFKGDRGEYRYTFDTSHFTREEAIVLSDPLITLDGFEYRLFSNNKLDKGISRRSLDSGEVVHIRDRISLGSYFLRRMKGYELIPGLSEELIFITYGFSCRALYYNGEFFLTVIFLRSSRTPSPGIILSGI